MLADDVTAALPLLRAEAERNMTDSCAITRAGTGIGPFNDATGQRDAPDHVAIYTGKCRVQIKSIIASSSASSTGERRVTAQEFELQLPVAGTDSIAVGDVAEILTAAFDDSLVGRKFSVSARNEKSQATARRLRVIEATA